MPSKRMTSALLMAMDSGSRLLDLKSYCNNWARIQQGQECVANFGNLGSLQLLLPAAAAREESSSSGHPLQAARFVLFYSQHWSSSRQQSLLQMSHLGYLDWSALLQGAQALHNLVKGKGVGVVKVEVSNGPAG